MIQPEPQIWVTGAAGLIGEELVRSAARWFPSAKVRGLTRENVDLTDSAAIQSAFRQNPPQAVIHCAAMSRSPDCQAQPELARCINVEATRVLAELAAEIPFIFFSSDLVFDGQKGGYIETDAVHPLSIYAETKVAAEEIILRNPRHTVVRTSLNYGFSRSGLRTFNEEMVEAWRTGRKMSFFTDEFRCPIAVEATARAVWELVQQNPCGIYHLGGGERLSRWEMAQLIAARHPEVKPVLIAGSLRDYKGAPRSPDTSLNSAKLQALLSFPLPGLRQSLTQPLPEWAKS